MKKKFTILIMLLSLIGGVKFNVLNAQTTTVLVGENLAADVIPAALSSDASAMLSQQIYKSSELETAGINEGDVINSIAFMPTTVNDPSVNWSVYVVNTDKETFSSNTDYVSISENAVYTGALTLVEDEFVTIPFTTSVTYTGENLLVCVVDYDNAGPEFQNQFAVYATDDFSLYRYGATPLSVTNPADGLLGFWAKQAYNRNYVQFVVGGEGGDTPDPDPDPDPTVPEAPETAPANLQATSVTHNSVTLTWDVVDGATYYEIYKNATYLDQTSATTYTATALSAETSYSFTVKAGNDLGTSPESEALSVTTKQFNGRTITFELKDSYGDGWNGGSLEVEFSDGEIESESLTIDNGVTYTHHIDVPYCTTVTVTYTAGDYSYENSFIIKDGDTEIYSSGGNSVAPSTTPYSFDVRRPAPQNLVLTGGSSDEIYSYDKTTIQWNVCEGAQSYNIYVNAEFKVNTEETTYELSELPHNTTDNGNAITVTAVVDECETYHSAPVYVKVAGTFNLVLNVKDNESNPIADAMVTITGYDEFDVQKNYEFTTDENGMVEETLPLPLKETQFSIEVSKAPYENGYSDITNYNWSGYVENGSTVTRDVTLQLTGVNQIDTDKEYYDENEPITLMWDAVEGATGYNVYEKYYDAEYNEVFTKLNGETLLTSTLYIIEDGLQYRENGNMICVTAVYTIGESDKYGTQVKVNGYGTVSGTVTDGTNPIKGASIVITGQDEYYQERTFTFTTAEDGTFEGSVVFGYDYTATVSKYGYEEVTIEDVVVTYASNARDFGTITLSEVEAQEATINNLAATINNDNVDVSWEAEYARYNVYRKDAAENYEQLGATTANTYTDESWATLENGEYTYGVSAFIEGGVGTIIEEHFEGDSYDAPAGWSWTENWSYSQYPYDASRGRSIISYLWVGVYDGKYYLKPSTPVSTANSTLTFDYLFEDYGYAGTSELAVYYATSSDGPWTNSLFHETSETQTKNTWHSATIDLSDIGEGPIYLAFCHIDNGFGPLYIDNIVVTGPVVTESSIVWASNALTKDDANVFTDTGEWTFATNWSNGVPADGANVFIEGNVTIASNVNVNNMTINGGSVTINNGASLTVEGTLVNEAAANLVINDGAQIFQNNEDVPATFVMNMEKPTTWGVSADGWQFISSPFDNASIYNFTSNITDDYDLFKYDGNEELEWVNYKGHMSSFGQTFEPGVGYLASCETEDYVELTGVLNAVNNFEIYCTYDWEGDSPLVNFTLIGNPFPFDMDMSKATYTNLVEGYAVVNPADGGYKYFAVGSSQNTADGTIKVGDGFFVKSTGEYPSFSYNVESRAKRGESFNSLNLIAAGNAGEDNLIINLAGKQEGFPKLKNFNDDIATLFVENSDVKYGIFYCNENTTEVEVSFHANQMGNYTIAAVPSGKFSSVILTDKFTGVETDLMVEDYNFTAMSTDNANRFIVKLAVSDQQSAVSDNFVYQSGEELIVEAEGTVQIIDVMGRVVYSDDVESTNNRIDVSGFRNGTYVVRVINETEVKVQKIIL